MKKFKCKYCKSGTYLWLLKPMRVEIPNSYITSTFHVKEICGKCHKYQRFIKQTDEVFERLKDAPILDGAVITPCGID